MVLFPPGGLISYLMRRCSAGCLQNVGGYKLADDICVVHTGKFCVNKTIARKTNTMVLCNVTNC